ncbi:hypothetical protein FSP39_010369 [Pinctada imbricata]|uniref:Uncharacterized protein n=1 Tax=Pinctada imbricata TaxID=66713 RepID=A0AA88XZX4_PINIB|nr:hypothetical protein FSP39_010369 [Pinctada imbricata]
MLQHTSEITLSYVNQGLRSDDEESSTVYTSSGNGSGYGTNVSEATSTETSNSSQTTSTESDAGRKSKRSSSSVGYGSTEADIEEGITDLTSSYHNPYYIYSDIPASPPGSPQSDRSFGHGTKSFNSSMRSKHSSSHAYTRQLNMFIGEEWENVHENSYNLMLDRKVVSCPPSPRVAHFPVIHQPIKVMHASSNDPTMYHADILHPRRAQHSLNYFFYHMSQEEPKTSKNYNLKPNPYNNINHKIHSALHCPCFLFFFFLCCLPGVYFMQEGDIQYKSGNEHRARKLGLRSTVSYCVGIVVGITFLSLAVFVAVQFVQGQVEPHV